MLLLERESSLLSDASGHNAGGISSSRIRLLDYPKASGGAWCKMSSLVPALRYLGQEAISACLRPFASDGIPVIGRSSRFDNLFMATGHFRNGLWLSPVTGIIISELILSGVSDMELAPFSPARLEAWGVSGARTFFPTREPTATRVIEHNAYLPNRFMHYPEVRSVEMGWDDPVVWILIAVVVVFLFGASRIPQFARSLGQARREFNEGSKSIAGTSSSSFANNGVDPSDPLIQAAQREGIDTAGKTREQIASEISWKLNKK